MRSRYDTGARYRLAAALAASLLIHAWFVHGYGERERSQPAASGMPLHATLVGRAGSRSEAESSSWERAELPPEAPPAIMHTPPAAAQDVPQERRGVETGRAVTVVANTPLSALPTPQDPTYYTARSLDVFPARLTAWDTALIRAAAQGASGSARAMLLIDETGVVNEVASVEGAAHGGLESAIRDLLLAARFSPALKDGRVVKARVLVNLDY